MRPGHCACALPARNRAVHPGLPSSLPIPSSCLQQSHLLSPSHAGTSVFFALKEACYAARADAGLTGWFRLDLPATPERLRMACADQLTAPFAAPELLPKISC